MPTQALVLNDPRTLHVVQERNDESISDAVLAVRSDGDSMYWAMFDLLGVPQARQILRDGQWHNDGFLPPNAAARALFAGLVFAWTPATELQTRYATHHIQVNGNTRVLSNDDQILVTVTFFSNDTLQLQFNDGARWRAAPLQKSQ